MSHPVAGSDYPLNDTIDNTFAITATLQPDGSLLMNRVSLPNLLQKNLEQNGLYGLKTVEDTDLQATNFYARNVCFDLEDQTNFIIRAQGGGVDVFKVDGAETDNNGILFNTGIASIANPTGAANDTDTEARAAIVSILTALRDLGLIESPA